MFRVAIELSVSTGQSGAFGRVSGFLNLAVVPRAGERLSFQFPHNGILPRQLEGFAMLVAVKGITHLAGAGEGDVFLELEDVELETDEDGAWLLAYLDQGFGLVPELQDGPSPLE